MAYAKHIHAVPQDFIDFYEALVSAAKDPNTPPGRFMAFLPLGPDTSFRGQAFNLAMRFNMVRGHILTDFTKFVQRSGPYESDPELRPPYHVANKSAYSAYTFKAEERDGIWGVLCQSQFGRLRDTWDAQGFDVDAFIQQHHPAFQDIPAPAASTPTPTLTEFAPKQEAFNPYLTPARTDPADGGKK